MDNWSKIEFIFAFKLNISPIELRELAFYDIQFMLKEYEAHVDRENKQYEKQQRDAEKQSKAMTNQNAFKVPTFNQPKF